ncbi:Elongation factor Ts, mitochondrial [Hondaea fermentalgiana]|uniref:Elongation factor Ts, mitochondrial n=1 Tax=Hondaea fermentalgiana TaxID=2315210 RepID=A0A2R5GU53_9STRA|nr:Elongation factor Ts, mitochondrial [Hondaea fermentalgiana]|eukprot:GBG32183.1 Elongation factor Ts, mitochondrial [Hondaea fermentalgiana]
MAARSAGETHAVTAMWRRHKVTAAMVKELRDLTNSPMMQCKKALSDPEVAGDMEKAVEWLRKQGQAQAAKKSDRTTNDGLVGIIRSDDLKTASLVEVTSETDFVARNELFQQLVREVATTALTSGVTSTEELAQKPHASSPSVQDALTNATATLGENIGLKAVHQMQVTNGVLGLYLHNKMGDGTCVQGAVVALESDAPLADLDDEKRSTIQVLADKLALQVVAAQALFLEDVPAAYIERERELEMARLRNEALERAGDKEINEETLQKRVGKKVDKIIKGLKEEQVLLNQKSFVPDHKGAKISKLLDQTSKSAKCSLSITSAARFQVGADKVILEPIQS